MKKHLNQKQGSSLIEIIMATAIVSLILVSIMLSMTYTMKLNSQSQFRALATQKAQETVDLFRRERTVLGCEDFLTVLENGQTYCVAEIPSQPSQSISDHLFDADEGDGVYPDSCGYDVQTAEVPIDFKREAYVEIDTSDSTLPIITVTITVSWDNENSADDFSVGLKKEFRPW